MIRNITIRPVLNGFMCEIGCQTVVFDSKEKLTIALAQYLDHPTRYEEEFLKTACNRDEGLNAPVQMPPQSEAEVTRVYNACETGPSTYPGAGRPLGSR